MGTFFIQTFSWDNFSYRFLDKSKEIKPVLIYISQKSNAPRTSSSRKNSWRSPLWRHAWKAKSFAWDQTLQTNECYIKTTFHVTFFHQRILSPKGYSTSQSSELRACDFFFFKNWKIYSGRNFRTRSDPWSPALSHCDFFLNCKIFSKNKISELNVQKSVRTEDHSS